MGCVYGCACACKGLGAVEWGRPADPPEKGLPSRLQSRGSREGWPRGAGRERWARGPSLWLPSADPLQEAGVVTGERGGLAAAGL